MSDVSLRPTNSLLRLTDLPFQLCAADLSASAIAVFRCCAPLEDAIMDPSVSYQTCSDAFWDDAVAFNTIPLPNNATVCCIDSDSLCCEVRFGLWKRQIRSFCRATKRVYWLCLLFLVAPVLNHPSIHCTARLLCALMMRSGEACRSVHWRLPMEECAIDVRQHPGGEILIVPCLCTGFQEG